MMNDDYLISEAEQLADDAIANGEADECTRDLDVQAWFRWLVRRQEARNTGASKPDYV